MGSGGGLIGCRGKGKPAFLASGTGMGDFFSPLPRVPGCGKESRRGESSCGNAVGGDRGVCGGGGLGLAPRCAPSPSRWGPLRSLAAIIGGPSAARAEAAAAPPVAQTSGGVGRGGEGSGREGGRGTRPVINHPQNASGKRQKQIKQRGNSAPSPLKRAAVPDDPFCGILKSFVGKPSDESDCVQG